MLAVALTAGCGGGGGGGKAQPTATPTGVPTAVPTQPAPIAGAGLQSDITGVQISGGRIVATFTLTDDAGVPITPLLTNAPNSQAARVRFTSAHIETYEGGGELRTEFSRYVNDLDPVRPKYDSNGTLETVDRAAGVYRYTFAKVLPADADLNTTYSIGLQVDRTYAGVSLSANPIFDLVPAGGTPQIREAVVTAQCNQCHNPLIAHGNRREVRLCTLCHTQAATDEKGTSIDLSVMVHKIHAGKDLPSVADGPPGSRYAIYSSFARAYQVFAEKDEDGRVTGVGFPRPLNDCANCHTGGATSHYATDRPAAAPCTSCHDDVNPSQVATAAGPPGTNHIQNRGFPDGDCQFCHLKDQTAEFDISVPGAHLIPEQSTQLQGLNIDIAGLASHGPGEKPVVSFKISNNAGEALRDLSGLNRLAFTLAGPTREYTSVLGATAVGGGAGGMLSGPAADGSFQYTLPVAVPADASGTWSLGAEARRSVTLAAPEGATRSVNEAAVNPVVTFSVGAQAPEVRRVVVEDAQCESCHGEFSKGFSIHGNLRNQMQYCVLCHNPNASDVARRRNDPAAVAAGDAVASIDFKYMIHKIHTGDELAHTPYVIYGFGAPPANYTAIDFSDVRFPGDRRDCQTCHAAGTNLIPPFPGHALGTQLGHLDPATGQLIVDGRLGPITSACTSCHDSDAAMAHAETQTGSSGEACEVCHAEGRDVAVSAAHVRNVQ
ncbi:OmcA/MtrC family decaheme c-type cytochrome [bacterium]|nr:OmcA/MtrC family decaheme c-type cytochrome [bacterium]